jgi:hypothetical protein
VLLLDGRALVLLVDGSALPALAIWLGHVRLRVSDSLEEVRARRQAIPGARLASLVSHSRVVG